jgi:mRNA interferase MazF
MDFSPHVGREMPAMHPMLVASTKAYNERRGIIGFPMTHSPMNDQAPFALKGRRGDEVFYVLGDMPKSYDWRARGAKPHPWGTGHHALLADTLRLLNDVIGLRQP